MKLRIDRDRCQGHAMCHLVAPGLFDVDDAGYGIVITPDVSRSGIEAATLARARCPEAAIIATSETSEDRP